MHAELKRLGLSGLPHEAVPDGVAVDALCTKAAKLVKLNKRVPFVNTSLRPFLPSYARSSNAGMEEDEERGETIKAMQKVMNIKRQKHELTFLQCLAALDMYVVAGAAANQFKLSCGLAHCAIIK